MSRVNLMLVFLVFSLAAWAQDAPAAAPQGPPPQGMDQGSMGHGPGHRGSGVAGSITAINADSIVIKTMDGKTAQVNLNSNTQFRKERQPVKLSDFKVGDEVFVRGPQASDGSWQAEMIGARPAGGGGGFRQGMAEGMGKQFIAGEVKAVNGTQLTIARPDGVTQTISVDENTSFRKQNESITLADIKPGDHVFGRGALKGDVFVPTQLNVGEPGMGMGRGNGQGRGTPPQ
jgi:hypothetical protein